jgi:hypothetical protein
MTGDNGLEKHPENPFSSQFPVFLGHDYDLSFPNLAWPIGLKSTFPEELVRRVLAAAISLQAGNSGIDYTYKRYLKGQRHPVCDGARLDWRIEQEIIKKFGHFDDLLYQVTAHGEKPIGVIISEWTFIRLSFSINVLKSCAQRGALFECCAIARTLLEQIAWAHRVHRISDPEEIKETSATKAISDVKSTCPMAGRLYGWLSAHCHWEYQEHVKTLFFEDERMGALFASSKFKAVSMTLILVIAIFAIRVFAALAKNEIAIIFKTAPVDLPRRPSRENFLGWPHSAPPDLAKLQSALDVSVLQQLINETASLDPVDRDLSELAEISVGL